MSTKTISATPMRKGGKSYRCKGGHMFSQNPFLRMETPCRSNEGMISAILNCICPDCGWVLSLATKQFRCGIDWRPM